MMNTDDKPWIVGEEVKRSRALSIDEWFEHVGKNEARCCQSIACIHCPFNELGTGGTCVKHGEGVNWLDKSRQLYHELSWRQKVEELL